MDLAKTWKYCLETCSETFRNFNAFNVELPQNGIVTPKCRAGLSPAIQFRAAVELKTCSVVSVHCSVRLSFL